MKDGGHKILLFGGTGLVGSEIAKALALHYSIICPSHSEVDVADRKQAELCIETVRPDYVIYAAGLARVDEAETDPDKAFLLNRDAPLHIARRAARSAISVCYISTDAVFDGTQSARPYRERDTPNPISAYGKSKLAGEQAVLSVSDGNVVVRISMAYSASYAKRKDTARIILASLRQGNSIGGITDQYLTPMFAPVTAKALNELIGKSARNIYHIGSTDSCTNYEFAKMIAKKFDCPETLISPITLAEFSKNKTAYRGRYAWLDTNKFREEFGKGILRTIDEDLADFKNEILSQERTIL